MRKRAKKPPARPVKRKAKAPARARRPAKVARPAVPSPSPTDAAPFSDTDLPAFERGTPRWIAYEEVVHKVESTFDVSIEEIHKRLDQQKLQGHRFTDLLDAVVGLTGLPAFYAGVVVRSYPGYETDDRDAAALRGFLKARRKA